MAKKITKVTVKKAARTFKNKIEKDKTGKIRRGVGKAAGGSGRDRG